MTKPARTWDDAIATMEEWRGRADADEARLDAAIDMAKGQLGVPTSILMAEDGTISFEWRKDNGEAVYIEIGTVFYPPKCGGEDGVE